MSSLRRIEIVSFRLNRDVHRVAGKKIPTLRSGSGSSGWGSEVGLVGKEI